MAPGRLGVWTVENGVGWGNRRPRVSGSVLEVYVSKGVWDAGGGTGGTRGLGGNPGQKPKAIHLEHLWHLAVVLSGR